MPADPNARTCTQVSEAKGDPVQLLGALQMPTGQRDLLKVRQAHKRRSSSSPMSQERCLALALHDAAQNGDAALVRRLVEAAADVDCTNEVRSRAETRAYSRRTPQEGRRPLHTALLHNRADIAHLLLQLGADARAVCKAMRCGVRACARVRRPS